MYSLFLDLGYVVPPVLDAPQSVSTLSLQLITRQYFQALLLLDNGIDLHVRALITSVLFNGERQLVCVETRHDRKSE